MNAVQNNNVVGLNVRSVYNSIKLFLSEEVRTENTRKNYKISIEQFFRHMKDKELSELVYNDKENDLMYCYEEVLGYRAFLKEKYNNKATTINAKITPLKKLFKYLKKVQYDVDYMAFDLDDIPELNSEKINIIPSHIAEQMIELALELPDQPEEKSLILEMLFYSSIRIDSVLNLKWKNFKRLNDKRWLITTVDKSKVHRKPISDRLYQKLLAFKKHDENVFTIKDSKTIGMAIKMLSEKMELKEKYTPHSFKKSLINWSLANNKDTRIAAKQGNHDLKTMQEYYEEEFQDWEQFPSVAYEEKIEINQLEGLSAEKLLEMIASCSRQTQLEILSKLSG